jgi:uncharacterized protein (DUF2252 family)
MPRLLARKVSRMRASPFAFLRGSAPLFYELLRRDRTLRVSAPAEGILVGDAHVENFGAFRSQNDSAPVFDVNDFDEAACGPLWLDVLRLVTSVILATRELGMSGAETMDAAHAALCSWQKHVATHASLGRQPREVARLLRSVDQRTARDLLHGRVTGDRRFVRGHRYFDLPKSIARAVPGAFARYLASIEEHERPREDHCEILDVAWRVAGTGSLGRLRIALLCSGKDVPWIFDFKEQGAPAAGAFVRGHTRSPAERVIDAARALLASPPRGLGKTTLAGLSLVGRRLSPVEDKLDLTRVDATELAELAVYLGGLLGRAHRRGIGRRLRRFGASRTADVCPEDRRRHSLPAPWPEATHARIIASACALAGIHEAIYLAYCALAPR